MFFKEAREDSAEPSTCSGLNMIAGTGNEKSKGRENPRTVVECCQVSMWLGTAVVWNRRDN